MLSKIAEAVKNIDLPSDTREESDEQGGEEYGINVDKISEKLPEIMSVMKLFGNSAGRDDGKPSIKGNKDRRIGLLLALRPYLSPHRCEVIDYIIKMNNIGEIFKNLM